MIERRANRRVKVDFWASLKHPLLGTITGEIRDMSTSGLSVILDEELNFFVMMELDVRIHGDGWDDSMPALPVQVVRVEHRNVALQFIDSCDDLWVPPEDEDDEAYSMLNFESELTEESKDLHAAHL